MFFFVSQPVNITSNQVYLHITNFFFYNMKKITLFLLLVIASNAFSQTILKELSSWKFSKGENAAASLVNFDDAA